MKHLLTLTALTALPGLALAHNTAGPGLMANLEHILSSSAHLWPLVVVAIVAAMMKRPVQRLLQQRTANKD